MSPVIINLRGTGGSGKSTIVRRVMQKYVPGSIAHVFEGGRRQPLAYQLTTMGKERLYVVGHYETACGGCDTIKTPDRVYQLIRGAIESGYDVIYEGIIVQDDIQRLLQLNREHKVHVIELSTPIEECLAGVQARRDERGDERPLNEKNTRDRAVRVRKTCNKLRDAGLTVPKLNREEAYEHCLKLLGLQ